MILILSFYTVAANAAVEPVKVKALEVRGKKYDNATITLESQFVAKVIHESGILRAPIKDLPETVQKALIPESNVQISAPTEKPEDPDKVSKEEKFRIVERKAIPNGGDTYQILIAPELATEKGLKEIIEEVRKSSINQRNTFAFMYDDMQVLRLRSKLNNLTAEEEKLWDTHFKAVYKKNGNTGFHESSIWPEGQSGSEIVVKY